MVPKFFIGVDISKFTLDIAVIYKQGLPVSYKIANTEEAVVAFFKRLREESGFKSRDVAVCAEHMGIYARFLTSVLLRKKIPLYLESALRIKRSLGIQRGKNDKVDAIRIAQYAKANFKDLKNWVPPRRCIEQLSHLITHRKKLLKAKVMITNDGKVNQYYMTKQEKEDNDIYHQRSLDAILKDIADIEKNMLVIIKHDGNLSSIFDAVTSIPHIGNIIGIQMIVATNEFIDFSSAKHFASYCGVAPFEWTSGMSTKGKSRVSHLADKEIKTSLHMAAIGTIRHKESFLGKYYIRKVGEGKNKMSVLNAVRNKLIHRIFSCVRTRTKFVDQPE